MAPPRSGSSWSIWHAVCSEGRHESSGYPRRDVGRRWGGSAVDGIRVASWSELHERLYEGARNAELGRFRSNMAFRGMPDARWDLTTSLARLGGDTAQLEGHLLRNFRKYAQRDAVPGDSVWNWLAVAQHHG